MSLVIWLNIVTIVAQSVCLLPTYMHEGVRANCIVNDGLINAIPNMQQMLLHFKTLV